MRLFELSYFVFGMINLYIVLVLPIFDFINTKKKVFALISIIILSSIFFFCFPSISNYLILLYIFVLVFFLSNKKLIAVCLSLFNYLLSIVLNYLTLLILEHYFGITELQTITVYYVPYYLFLTALYVLSSFLVRSAYNSLIGNYLETNTLSNIILLLYLATCALLFIFNYNYEASLGFTQDIVRVNTILFLVFFLVTTAYIILMMVILRRDAKIQARNAQYESLQQYTEQVENLYLDMRGFKHDYINILSTMQIYMEQEDWENLRTYYENEILPTRNMFQNSSQEIGQLSNLQIPELKSILYNKLVKSLELGLHVHLEIRQPITRIDMKPVDLTRIIGIYLDNAIDALLEIDSESDLPRNLSVACFEHEDATVIIIENTCKDFTLNLHKLGTLSYSTKGKNRGMGLHLATKTLRSYRNVLKETKYKDHVFTQILKIYYT